MGDFLMPSLGADMEAGILVEWLRRPGDRVQRGDIVAVVETDKGAIEVEIFEEGVIDRLLVDVGTKVPVGTPLAALRATGERAPAAPVAVPPSGPAPETAERPRRIPPPPAVAPPMPLGATSATGAVPRPHVSPAARRIAAERGVDLSRIAGSGPGGAVVSRDVESAAEVAKPRTAERGTDLAAMRRAIGAAMARSKREIPHYYLSQPVDLRSVEGHGLA
jgi:pyruvate dehydrogenase E2 component (dihydrolipoamide acetyltransferase)